jgi:hypothetical protein
METDEPHGTHERTNAKKDPEDWVTKDEPMTGAQHSYLHTLAQEAGEQVDENLTKGEASKKIDELQQKTGRGSQPQPGHSNDSHDHTE